MDFYPRDTKVKINTSDAYAKQFNGQGASALDTRGKSGETQMFTLHSGGGVFLSPQDVEVVEQHQTA